MRWEGRLPAMRLTQYAVAGPEMRITATPDFPMPEERANMVDRSGSNSGFILFFWRLLRFGFRCSGDS